MRGRELFDQKTLRSAISSCSGNYSTCSCELTLRTGLVIKIKEIHEISEALCSFRIYPKQKVPEGEHQSGDEYDTIVVPYASIEMLRFTASEKEVESLSVAGFNAPHNAP